MTWKELIRKLKAAGFVEKRTGKGAHKLFVHPATGKEIWVTIHGTRRWQPRQPHLERCRSPVMAATQFPIVFEPEASGVISAYVPGVPVYAQGATQKQAERAIRRTLAAYLEVHPEATCSAAVRVAAVRPRARQATPSVTIVGPAALVGGRTSRRKAASSRANGRLGGRPPKVRARTPRASGSDEHR